MKESYNEDIVYEKDSSYYTDEVRLGAGGNITLAANYDATPCKKSRSPGHNGDGVVIPFYRMKEEREGYKLHGFNSLASDVIPLERRLKDYRKIE